MEPIEKLHQLIDGIGVAMLTTVEEDGSLRSRPMAAQRQVKGDGVLWFFTRGSSHKVEDVERDQHVNLSFSSPEDKRYVSLSGLARVVHDGQKLADLWFPILKAWFPEGLQTPDIALLRVEVTFAEYWDSPSNRMTELVGLVRARMAGESYQPEENKTLEFGEPGHTLH
jgi:general stress protein 26